MCFYIDIHLSVYTTDFLYVCMCICIYKYIYTYIYIYIYICTYIYIYIYICTYIYIYMYLYIYIYIYDISPQGPLELSLRLWATCGSGAVRSKLALGALGFQGFGASGRAV